MFVNRRYEPKCTATTRRRRYSKTKGVAGGVEVQKNLDDNEAGGGDGRLKQNAEIGGGGCGSALPP